MLETPGSAHHIHELGDREEKDGGATGSERGGERTCWRWGLVRQALGSQNSSSSRIRLFITKRVKCRVNFLPFTFRIQVYRHQLHYQSNVDPASATESAANSGGQCQPGPAVFIRGYASWHHRLWTAAYYVLDSLFWWMKVAEGSWKCG